MSVDRKVTRRIGHVLAALAPSFASRHIDRRFHGMHASLAVPRGSRIVWMKFGSLRPMTSRRNYVLCNVLLECVLSGYLSFRSMIVYYQFVALLAEGLVSILVCCIPQEREIVVLAEMWFLTRHFRLVERGEPHCCFCLLYTSPSPRDGLLSRMPSSA